MYNCRRRTLLHVLTLLPLRDPSISVFLSLFLLIDRGLFSDITDLQDTIIPRGAKDIEGNVISSRVDSSKNAYVIEYTIKSGGVPRHLVTVFSLQPGRYLLTLTGQSLEGTWSAQEAVIKAVADSYQLKIKE